MRTVVAMSGGVDSSVAAALVADRGDAVGLSMQLYDASDTPEGAARPFGRCCSIDDLSDARRVAARIGIPHYIVNFEREFSEKVIGNLVREYTAGRTPIPCVHCNGDLKFATLLERAEGLGADRVATGHYARVRFDEDTRTHQLLRGVDAGKDQSYFLFTLSQAQLARAEFPIGGLAKADVRAIARERGLPVADKPDSHEICFIPDGDHASFVAKHAPEAARPGVFTDASGNVVGTHDGAHRFTVGQRKGLRLATGVPLYVLEIDAPAQNVTVGPREALERFELEATDVNWIAGAPPAGPTRVTARIRHRAKDAAATVVAIGDGARVAFDEPQIAIAPGQAVVFYNGDVVIGGGWIA
ncbi:MAG TPA: tRNA 2-thiouridine(34) synthase MnmA [Vicinamibacterales bacterium]|nr:tRNA 2-thiouridine(34) synthase MnmA [Vicinamibacterales bacterium]